MRTLAVPFVLALFAAGSVTAHASELFKSDELKFEIQFPAEPQRKSRTQMFASGEAQIVRFKSIGETLRPSISVTVFSRGPFTKEEALAGIAQSGLRQAAALNGTVVSQKDLMVNGFAGKETVIEGLTNGNKFFYRAQTFYAGNRQYVLSVAAAELQGVTTPANGYFDSFKPWD